MLTAMPPWRPASHEVSAKIDRGQGDVDRERARDQPACSDLRPTKMSRPNATMPIATASRAVPGNWPDDSEA